MVLIKQDFNKTNFSKKQLPEKKLKNRWGAFILLFTTAFLSASFWIKANFNSWQASIFKTATYQIVKPSVANLSKPSASPVIIKDLADLHQQITNLLNGLQGTYGIYFYNLTNKESWGINENKVFTAASVIKLPIMISFYQQVEQGTLKEDGEYYLRQVDIQDYGTGQMRYQALGTKYTYGELVRLSGKLSDNTAAYVLQQLIGTNKIQAVLTKLGMINTSLINNETTPKETGDYFIKLYQDKLLKPVNKEKIYTALTNTDFEDRITKGVPEGIRVVHKIGNEIQIYNDCGIVFGPKSYVLCIMSDGVAENEALDVIPRISRLFWEFVNQ